MRDRNDLRLLPIGPPQPADQDLQIAFVRPAGLYAQGHWLDIESVHASGELDVGYIAELAKIAQRFAGLVGAFRAFIERTVYGMQGHQRVEVADSDPGYIGLEEYIPLRG